MSEIQTQQSTYGLWYESDGAEYPAGEFYVLDNVLEDASELMKAPDITRVWIEEVKRYTTYTRIREWAK